MARNTRRGSVVVCGTCNVWDMQRVGHATNIMQRTYVLCVYIPHSYPIQTRTHHPIQTPISDTQYKHPIQHTIQKRFHGRQWGANKPRPQII